MKDVWYEILNKCGMKTFSIHNAVCSDHFRPFDMDRDGFRVVLKKGVVPSLYLDKPKPKSQSERDNFRVKCKKFVVKPTVKYIYLNSDDDLDVRQTVEQAECTQLELDMVNEDSDVRQPSPWFR